MLRKGRVTSVTSKDGNTVVDVQLLRSGVQSTTVPILKPLSGITFVPNEGDIVVIDKLEGSGEVVVGVFNNAPFPQPDHENDEFSFKLDDGTEFSFTKNGGGDYDISISCLGSITVDSGTVRLGGDSGTAQVARKGDSVEVDGVSGTITGGSSVTESQ